ncbi:hypothetical protein MAPG_07866 [Magnaporthiopsis poae ATCC 64411]|uniref:2,5-diamino-6-ribosylamino-4(3H)-pyrimidinone 5'-phosphate reductase n=1 Tax=Magnaporthiopsis poae (strain ATCC 64411 / 73-15) TaxID=644358 RepID=A0A0C4E5U1_MAGP6|nr:hypothetical protein MAPG_07866 [Magnaporthiopsis poae ATCC 64411]
MGKLRYNVAASLDGFIARPDGSYDWIPADDSINFDALYAEFDAFIMGRKTYETMLAQGDQNPLRNRPSDRVAVVTSTGLAAGASSAWGVTVLAGTAEAVAWVTEARRRFGRDVWLMIGGGKGGGTEGPTSRRLRLTGSEILASGIAICKYEVIYESSGGDCQTTLLE